MSEEMTDKQIIECKYKFQSIEKFAGKPYCTLFNETCEFINFVCDKNCQVYEDYKQLKAKEQECEELNKELRKNFEEKDTLHLIIDRLLEASGYDTNTASAEDFEDVYEKMRYEKQQLDAYKMEAEEGKEINAELKAKNKELIKDYFTVIQQRNVAEQQLDQLKGENEELKEKVKKYGEINEQETKDYAELKAENETLFKAIEEVNKINKRLEAENKELKEWKKEHLKDVEFIERNPVIDILNSMADNILLEQQNEKLKQTLIEIKEIAEDAKTKVFVDMEEFWKQILQKISEVEDEN